MATWVKVEDLKNDQGLDAHPMSRDDKALERVLDAAADFVQQHRPDLNYYSAESVPPSVRLGTYRLAARWALGGTDLGELGADRRGGRIDRDIRELLGLDR